MSTTIMHSLTFIVFTVSKKIATLKVSPIWTLSWPYTSHFIDKHFSCESKMHKLVRGITNVMLHPLTVHHAD